MSTVTILLLLGALGGLLPDILRFLKDNSTAANYKQGVKILSLVFQIGLGVLAVYILLVVDLEDIVNMDSKMAIKALGLGFAAPELITRAVSTTGGGTTTSGTGTGTSGPGASPSGLVTPKPRVSLRDWWGV